MTDVNSPKTLWSEEDFVPVKRRVVAAASYLARKHGATNTLAALQEAQWGDTPGDWQARAEAADARKPLTVRRVAVAAIVPFFALYLLATGRKMGG